MRRTRPLALILLAACASAERLDPSITKKTVYAELRAFAAVTDLPAIDLVSKIDDTLPGTLGATPSPGVSAFARVPAGEAVVYGLSAGNVLAQVPAPIAEGKRYSAFVTGSGEAVSVAVVEEAFAPVTDKARVRLLDMTGLADLRVDIGGPSIAAGLEKPADWAALAPDAAARVSVGDPSGPRATFSNVDLSAGTETTLLLASAAGGALRLLVVRESATGIATTLWLDADGVVKPKAHVRFLHAAPGAAAVTVLGARNAPLAEALPFKALSANVDLPIDEAVAVADAASAPLLAAQPLALEADKTYTVALVGNPASGAPLKLITWEDQRGETSGPTARLAVAVPGAPGSIALVQSDGTELIPATANATASAYVAVPSGPLEAIGNLSFGPRTTPLGRVTELAFPANHAITLLLTGTFVLQPPSADLALVVIDDFAGTVLEEKIPQPITP